MIEEHQVWTKKVETILVIMRELQIIEYEDVWTFDAPSKHYTREDRREVKLSSGTF